MTDAAFLDAYFAISATKAQYCRTLDTKDWAGFADCFTEDLELDTRPSGGDIVKGRDAAIKMVRGSLDGATTAHQIHSPEIKLNGDNADVIWAMQDRVIFAPERAPKIGFAGLTGYGHYHEHYVRQGDRWRIARQVLTRLHMDTHPL